MVVASTVSHVSQNGNGVTTVVPYPYPFIAAADLVVNLVNADASITLQVLTTNYTISGTAPYPSGANVTMNVAPPTGSRVVIDRVRPLTQALDLVENDPLPADPLEQELDSLVMIAQQLNSLFSRVPALAITSLQSNPTLADLVAGAAVIVNGAATGLIMGPTADQITSAQTYATNAATSATASATSATAAAASATSAAASAAGMKYRAARIATTANDTLSGLAARDGITPVAGDRVLAKNQSTTAANGLYVAASGAWARATDMDTWVEVPGTVVVVTEGTVNGDKVFLCTSNDGGTLESTAITFVDWAAVIFDNSITAAKLISSIITDLATVSIASGDYVAISDTSDSGNKKKALVSDIVALVTIPAAAVQADMEAATSTTTYVTPAVAKHNPGSAKAWVKFSLSGGTPTINASYNVTSLTDNGVGNWTVNFTTAFSSADYCAQVTPSAKTAGSVQGNFGQVGTMAAGSCQIFASFTNASGVQLLTDADQVYAVFFGDQ